MIEDLIVENKIYIFLFGSKSDFNDLCLSVVTRLKEKYPNIQRVYIRAEYPYIEEDYKKYLLEHYENTYYPKNIIGAGKAVYIKRNYEMIDKSDFCVVFFDENYKSNKKSGTKSAYDYAVNKNKTIINMIDYI